MFQETLCDIIQWTTMWKKRPFQRTKSCFRALKQQDCTFAKTMFTNVIWLHNVVKCDKYEVKNCSREFESGNSVCTTCGRKDFLAHEVAHKVCKHFSKKMFTNTLWLHSVFKYDICQSKSYFSLLCLKEFTHQHAKCCFRIWKQ